MILGNNNKIRVHQTDELKLKIIFLRVERPKGGTKIHFL